MDCSCDVNGNGTTHTLPATEPKIKSQTILPKTAKHLQNAKEGAIVPATKLKSKNIYLPYSLEKIKTNAYADWLRNQIR